MHVGYESAFQNRFDCPDHEFVRRELEFCLRAEELGFDSVWLTEHHFSDYGLIPDPLQALTYIGSRTSTIQLGTAVLVLPWHDPVRLAEQVLLADLLSGGRLVVGLGRGLGRDEYEGLRVPMDRSRALFDEYARILLDGLTTGIVEGGATLAQPRRELRPRPARSFDGRLFSATVSPQSGPLMARLGVGAMYIIVKPPELLQLDHERYRDAWREIHGAATEPPQSLLSATVVVDPDPDRALELATRYDRAAHRVAVDHYGMDKPEFGTVRGYEYYRIMRAGAAPQVDRPPATVVYGTPDQVLEKLADYRKRLDLQGVLAIFHGIPDEDGARSLRCFAEHCLPELKRWPARRTF
ncbi:LLM class flavin-dependent oxidoreductase [Nocardia sp. NPDC004068]|uniref:LLM class flavin-dependent oxidoreductase n=1 Tax=Nocardia sp. NPDC004068 TaxID=3364303 RepID=UPI0036ACEADA